MELNYIFFLMITSVTGAKKGCGNSLEDCSREFQNGLEQAGIKEPESSLTYCRHLRSFGQCVKRTTKGCRGDLSYHFSSSLVETLARRYNCSQHKTKGEKKTIPSKPAPCTYLAINSAQVKECGFYGAPDLRTFSNNYQKCNVVGTWPLLDNNYLAVQITNSPLDKSLVIATTKVTVIIKTTDNSCLSEKTYEATSETSLPEFFIDGTDTSGEQKNVFLKSSSTNRRNITYIYLRHIESRVSVIQAGPYLGCSVTMPEQIIGPVESSGEIELCRRGCPLANQLKVSGEPAWPHWCSSNYSDKISGNRCIFELINGVVAEPSVADSAYRTVLPFYLFLVSPLITYTIYL